MERTGLVLVLAVGILGTSAYGYQLPGIKFVSKTNDKSTAKSIIEQSTADEVDVNRVEDSFICFTDGLYPHPMDCNQFTHCSNGKGFIMKCPSGLHFSREREICESPEDAGCDRNIQMSPRENDKSGDLDEEIPRISFTCPRDGLFANREDCKQYYECSGPRLLYRTCPPGLHFNKRTKTCDTPCKGKCDRRIRCPRRKAETLSTETPDATSSETSKKFLKLKTAFVCSEDGLFPNSTDCSKYINCSNGNAYELSCPPSRHFNNVTKQCETFCSANCDPNLICNWEDSMLRIEEAYLSICTDITNTGGPYYVTRPNHCDTYYKCEGREMNKFRCPGGQHFSNETSRCEEPCVARCDYTLAERCGFEYSTETIMEFLEGDCIKGERNFIYRLLNECKYYFKCQGGEVSVVRCPDGQNVNIKTFQCDEPCVARCDASLAELCGWGINTTESEIAPTQMSPRGYDEFEDLYPRIAMTCEHGHFYPDSKSCDTFYECYYNRIIIHRCFPRYHYNRRTEKCETACKAKCDPSIYCPENRTNASPATLTKREPDVILTPLKSSKQLCSKDGTYLERNPLDCNSYFKCMDGDADLLYCPDGHHFNQQTLQCEEACDAQCDSTMDRRRNLQHTHSSLAKQLFQLESEFICADDGVYPNPENCNSYITCILGESFYTYCPEKLHFSEKTQSCEPPCEARCEPSLDCDWDTCGEHQETKFYGEVDCEAELDEGPCKGRFPRYGYDTWSGRCRGFFYGGCGGNSNNFRTMEECENKCRTQLIRGYICPLDNGMFVNYPNCLSYYHCKRGIATLKKCPKGKAFDRKKLKCVTENEAACIFECTNRDGVYPYEGDLRKYIACVNGISKLKTCPTGKAFDPEKKDCIDKRLVDTWFWE